MFQKVLNGKSRFRLNCLTAFLYATIAVGILLPAYCSGTESARGEEQLGDLTGPWQLFVDDYLIEDKDSVIRTYHQFKKHPGNPVLVADRPWEGTLVYLYGTVLPAEDGNGYRMWYHSYHIQDRKYRNLYATSRDGIVWEKPNLGIVEFDGSSQNNLVPHEGTGHNPQVIHTPWDPNPRRKYKRVTFSYNKGYCGSISPDGISWKSLADNPILLALVGDVGNFVWDPHTKRYIGYPKIFAPVRGQHRRCVGFSATSDFESWPPAELILVPDEFDDRWVTQDKQRTDLYGLCAFAYESRYIGFLWVFRITDGDNDGPTFCELVSSRDGFNWKRQEPFGGQRVPLLPTGPKGSWDGGIVYTSSHPLVEEHKIKLWYGGFNTTHGEMGEHVRSRIGLATLRKDGFVSLDAGEEVGTVTTKPLKNIDGQLHLNADATGGWLKVEVLDSDGKILSGYSRDDCIAIKTDGTKQLVLWKSKEKLPRSEEPMRLRFIMANASLYSFMAGEHVEVATSQVSMEAFFTFEGDSGKTATDKLTEDGVQQIRFHNGVTVIKDETGAAHGSAAVVFSEKGDITEALEILDTLHLGSKFTFAVMTKPQGNKLMRLFSAHRGIGEPSTGELIFDINPNSGILRFIVNGQKVQSKPRFYRDGQYHHFAVTYDQGSVKLYLDGQQVGQGRVRSGSAHLLWDRTIVEYFWPIDKHSPVGIHLATNLRVGNDQGGRFISYKYEAFASGQARFVGFIDDVLIAKRVLSAKEIAALSKRKD